MKKKDLRVTLPVVCVVLHAIEHEGELSRFFRLTLRINDSRVSERDTIVLSCDVAIRSKQKAPESDIMFTAV
jgi:hypothetical protein